MVGLLAMLKCSFLTHHFQSEYNILGKSDIVYSMGPIEFKNHLHKVINVYDLVKVKLSGSMEPVLTKSTSAMIKGLQYIKMNF